jgi:alpha-tubulin suppressor-like RCC1 family protein/outer membrane protein OmpA-like peptidoglycan-associated protein
MIREDDLLVCWGTSDFNLSFRFKLSAPSPASFWNIGDAVDEMGSKLPRRFYAPASSTATGINYSAFTLSAVSVGEVHGCAVTKSGAVRCWGDSTRGQRGKDSGNGVYTTALLLETPVDLGPSASAQGVVVGGTGTTGSLTSVIWKPPESQTTAGSNGFNPANIGTAFSCALLASGAVRCWGSNNYGQVGVGLAPADATTACGTGTANSNSCIGDEAGEMAANTNVNLGTGLTASTIAAGGNHVCAILVDSQSTASGGLKCWGRNNYGQLGYGTSAVSGANDVVGETPGDIAALNPVNLGQGVTARAVAAGEHHTCVITNTGGVKCWGRNNLGQLGYDQPSSGTWTSTGDDDGDMGSNLADVNLGAGRTALAITAGSNFTCALLDTQNIKCWGDHSKGQLGLGDNSYQSAVGDATGEMAAYGNVNLLGQLAIGVTAGSNHVCATLASGAVKCWGSNAEGALGIGSSDQTFGITQWEMNNLTTVDLVTFPGPLPVNSAVWGNGKVTIDVGTAWNGGDSTGYSIQYCRESSGVCGGWTTAGGNPFEVTGITNGVATTVRVRQLNSLTSSGSDCDDQLAPCSVKIRGTAQAVPAAAPTITSITPGNRTLSVGLTAPSDNGGSAITNYEYSTDDGATWVAKSPAATSSFSITTASSDASLLVNGTTYQVKIRAVTGAGSGASSTATAGTPRTTPSAPTISGITAGDTQLSVNVTPGSDGGSSILNWQYKINNGPAVSTTDASLPIVITGLTNATSYSIKVIARNAAGYSSESAALSGTPIGPPNAPSLQSVTQGNQLLNVNFTNYTSTTNGGSAIVNIEYSIDNGVTWTAPSPAVTSSPLVIPNLTNGTSYPVRIRAVNAVGASSPSIALTRTPATAAGAPTINSLQPLDGGLRVHFTAGDNGGSAIMSYDYSIDGGTSWLAVSPVTNTSPFSITGLTNGTSYPVAIRAYTSINGSRVNGAASTALSGTPAPPPPTPTIDGITVGDARLSIALTIPAHQSQPISNIEYSLDGGSSWLTPSPAVTSGPLEVVGLINGTSYDVQLRTVNSLGTSSPTLSRSSVPAAPASAPTITQISHGDGVLDVFFTSATPNGAAITNYEVSLDGGTSWSALSPAATTGPIQLSGLTNGATYRVALRPLSVINGVPVPGGVSAAMDGTPSTVPSAPVLVTATPGQTNVELVFTAGFDGGSPILNYQFSTDGGTTWVTRNPLATTSPWLLDGLQPQSSVDIAIRAMNANGTGPSSSRKAVTLLSSAIAGEATLSTAQSGTTGLVNLANRDQFEAEPGEGQAVVDGVPVTPTIVSIDIPAAQKEPEQRTPTEIKQIQKAADELVDDLNDLLPEGQTPPVSIDKTETGAVLNGVATVPVPVEDVKVVKVQESALLVAGTDVTGTKAASSDSGGVLEIVDGGKVATVAYGLIPGANGELYVMSNPILLDNFKVGENGTFKRQAQLPASLPAGDHTIVVATTRMTVSLGLKVRERALPTREAKVYTKLPMKTHVSTALTVLSADQALSRRIHSLTPVVCLGAKYDVVFLNEGRCVVQIKNAKSGKVVRSLVTIVGQPKRGQKTIGTKITSVGPILFETGTAGIRSPGASTIRAAKKAMSDATSILVVGHSGSALGNTAQNQRLSVDRAAQIKSLLVKGGVRTPISAYGLGALDPVTKMIYEFAQRENRRVAVYLIP